jgi:hypothetical protein
MADNDDARDHRRPPGPSPDLEGLDRLVGKWEIRGGEKGSPAYHGWTFGDDGDTLTGAWDYPGGGYEVTSTRVERYDGTGG